MMKTKRFHIEDIFSIEILDFAFGIHWDVLWPEDIQPFIFVEPYTVSVGCDIFLGKLVLSFCTPFQRKVCDA